MGDLCKEVDLASVFKSGSHRNQPGNELHYSVEPAKWSQQSSEHGSDCKLLDQSFSFSSIFKIIETACCFTQSSPAVDG